MVLSHCGDYLFTADEKGYIKNWSIRYKIIFDDFGQVDSTGLEAFVITEDDKWLYTAGYDGYVKKYKVKGAKIDTDLGKISEFFITSMAI